MDLSRLFQALRHREYRLFFAGQLVSTTGTWMQTVAQAWLVYRITGSSAQLGLVAFAGLLPVLLLGIPMGSLADHLPRRRLLVVAQTVAMLQATALAVLTWSGDIGTWEIALLAMVLGLVNALEMPTRHAFIAELVPEADLPNAIALNSSVFNLARFLGPALAGAMLAVWSEAHVFALNAISFLAVLIGLFHIRPRPAPHGGVRAPGHLTAGLHHAWNTRTVRHALILLGTVSLAGTSYSVLMPVITHRLFGGGALTLGMLLGCAGFGALLAALRLAWHGGRSPLEQQAGIAALMGGAGLLALGNTHSLWTAVMLLLLLGFAFTTLVASVNTLLQTSTPMALRGRTMAVFSTLFIGFNALGNLLSGTLAEHLGTGLTVAGFGVVCLAGGIWYRRSVTRPAMLRPG